MASHGDGPRERAAGAADAAAEPAPGGVRRVGDRAARVVTEVGSPVVVAAAVLVGAGLHAAPGPRGLGLGVLAATFACLLPLAAVLVLVRRRRLTDHHVRVRSQRALPLGIGITSTVTGIGLLVALGAPAELVRVAVTMLAGLAVALLVNLRWKASVHVAVACGAVAVGTALGGPGWLLAAPLVPVIAWSRVRLADHTAAQTVGGAVFGTVTTVVVLTGLSLA